MEQTILINVFFQGVNITPQNVVSISLCTPTCINTIDLRIKLYTSKMHWATRITYITVYWETLTKGKFDELGSILK